MVRGIAAVWLPVTDMERAVGFYGGTLGLEVGQQQSDWAELDANGVKIGLNASKEETPGGEGGAVVAFQPQQGLDEAVAELQQRGTEVPDGISEHPWGRIAVFHDPDGNVLQLYEAPKG